MEKNKNTYNSIQFDRTAERLEIVNRIEQKEHEILSLEGSLESVEKFSFLEYGCLFVIGFIFFIIVLCLLSLVLSFFVSKEIERLMGNCFATIFEVGLFIAPIVFIVKYILHDEKYHNNLRIQNRICKLKKETENLKSEYFVLLITEIRDHLAIPIDDNAITYEDQDKVEELIQKHYSLVDKYQTTEDVAYRQQLRGEMVNNKLHLFYLYSIKGEAKNTYPVFEQQLYKAENTGDYGLMRVEVKDEVVDMHFNNLQQYAALLNDNKMTSVLRKLNKVKNIDTEGFFGFQSVGALAEKTELLQDLLRKASAEYNELMQLNENIGYLLEYLRVCAYRNIYLGVELLNYLRDNAGGKSLTTEKGTIDMKVELKNIDISFDSLRMDVIGNLTNSVSDCIEMGTKILKNKDMVNFVKRNPKTALGLAGLKVIDNYVTERNEKIEQNTKIQKEIINNINLVVDNYTQGQGQLLRAIEIIKAIKKTNDGYMNIYEPLKHKVFDENHPASVTMKDLQQLALAANEYNKISQAKL
ncbi:MAG: hypothetical protein IJP79_09035 [Paludibacteraceae bacterium]|nr:hypothetical protein [Paludibacteraceae bacterium]